MKRAFFILAFTALLAPPAFCATAEENNKILKDAIVGAITGAVSTEGSKDGSNTAMSEAVTKTTDSDIDKKDRHRHGKHKNHKDKKKNFKPKKRPHGWDMGKKTGWGGKDVPPGKQEGRS